MTFIRNSVVAVGMGVFVALPAAAETPNAATVLATVGETEITLGHVIAMQENLPDQYRQLPDDVLYTGILDQLIQQAALAAAMDGDLSTRDSLSLENEQRGYLANSVLQEAATAAVTDQSVQEAYDSQYANAEPEMEFNASHILVESEEEAQALVTELEGGADFAELAQAKSIGPSGPNGGSLGWFGKGMMVAPFEEAVLTLEAGQTSGPVQTQFGWHVVKLNETREKEVPTLETVRDDLVGQLEQAAISETIEALSNEADIARVEIEIDPALIRDSSLLD